MHRPPAHKCLGPPERAPEGHGRCGVGTKRQRQLPACREAFGWEAGSAGSSRAQSNRDYRAAGWRAGAGEPGAGHRSGRVYAHPPAPEKRPLDDSPARIPAGGGVESGRRNRSAGSAGAVATLPHTHAAVKGGRGGRYSVVLHMRRLGLFVSCLAPFQGRMVGTQTNVAGRFRPWVVAEAAKRWSRADHPEGRSGSARGRCIAVCRARR